MEILQIILKFNIQILTINKCVEFRIKHYKKKIIIHPNNKIFYFDIVLCFRKKILTLIYFRIKINS